MTLDQEKLRELFTYSPDGKLLSNISSGRWVRGKPIGHVYKCGTFRGYYVVRFLGKALLLHRLVWTLHFGAIPDGYVIDHINGDPLDNRIENLRAVTRSLNQRNARRPKHNKSGIVGVYSTPRGWVAAITLNNRFKFLGRFKRFEDAVACRANANERYGFHANHGRVVELPAA